MSLLDEVLKDLERQWKEESGEEGRSTPVEQEVHAPNMEHRGEALPEYPTAPVSRIPSSDEAGRRNIIPVEALPRLMPHSSRAEDQSDGNIVPQRTVADSLPPARPMQRSGRINSAFVSRLRQPKALREAMILREILDRPISLRRHKR
jgi:hypothetical protein